MKPKAEAMPQPRPGSAGWIDIRDGLPPVSIFGPYRVVDVLLKLGPEPKGTGSKRIPMPPRRHVAAECRFLGNDPRRPFWTDHNAVPIENGAWYVAYWRPMPELPECERAR